MSHLLASINPEASDNIRPIPPRQPLPSVGEMVVYTMRPGHSRSGRTRFPAMVMGEQGGKLFLTVTIDAGDTVDESLVEEAGPGAEFHCWERVQPTAVPGIHGTVAALHERIGELEESVIVLEKSRNLLVDDITGLRRMILGDYETPKIALFEIFAKIEQRVKALEAGPAKAAKSKK